MVSKLVPQIGGVTRHIGVNRRRTEDPLVLMGKATYVDDIHIPGMVEVAFLRSTHAHADIKRIDLSKAREHPDCIKIYTSAEIFLSTTTFTQNQGNLRPVVTPLLADKKVRFVGEVIAAVVAPTRYLAEDIVDLITVEYEPHPAVVDVEEAMKVKQWNKWIHEEVPNNVYFTDAFDKGDCRKAFKEADLVVNEKVKMGRTSAAPMEGRAIVANWEWDDTLTVWVSTQTPFMLRTHIAVVLQFPEQNVRVIAPHVGGAFGQKACFMPEEFLVPWIAKDIRRPVKWIEDRREHLLAAPHAKQMTMFVELAMKKDGTILGMRNKVISDSGAYSSYPLGGIIDAAVANSAVPGTFAFQNFYYEATAVLTNKTPSGPYRGVGWSGGAFAREVVLNIAAHKLGIDIADIYYRNFIGKDQFPFVSATNQTYDSGDFHRLLDKLLEVTDYRKLKKQPRLLANGRLRGVGISTFVEPTAWGSRVAEASGFRGITFFDSATVEVQPTGKVTVRSGQFGHGQGTKTTMAQVAAEVLGVPFEDVRVIEGDTEESVYGFGTGASRSAVIGGGTVMRAAHDVRNKLLKIAAHVMEANEADLNIDGGRVFVKGSTDRYMTVAELAHITYFDRLRRPDEEQVEPILKSTRYYDPPETYSSGGHCIVIELDPATGHIEITRIVGIEDCGTMINPKIVEGQMRGGAAQAVGMAMFETLDYDASGQLRNASFMDFLVPTASVLPAIECTHISTPSPLTEGGIKGCGESAMLSAHCAVAGAVADALSDYGVHVPALTPMDPESILNLVRSAQRNG
jgi:carbon-monoxide dehydrogenase large subunit